MEENAACRWTGEHLCEPPRRQVTINMVPDVALIEIFDFYMSEALDHAFGYDSEAWIILAHVCQKWRDIVFGSPLRLNVRLRFRAGRSVRVMLDTWPPLPIDIWGSGSGNIVAALEHNDRIHKIDLGYCSKSYVEQAFAAMQNPFPSLTELAVQVDEMEGLVVPDLFLGGSAPLLRSLRLRSILFPPPVLRKLLLSATDLVEIRIWRIPNSGLISPEAVVACLSALTRLEEFELGFLSSLYSGSRRAPSSTRCVLPALTSLRFNGPCQYLERLIAPIDSPLLDNLDIILFNQPVPDAPQLAQFVDRTPKLKALREAHVFFDGADIFVSLTWTRRRGLHFRIRYMVSIPVMVQLCTSSFLRTLIPMMKHLYIDSNMGFYWLDDVGCSQLLDLLRPFTTVEDLYLSQLVSPHMVTALHGIIGEGMTEVLPSLQNLFLEKLSPPGPVKDVIGEFVAALHLSSRSIKVSQWDRVRDLWWQLEDR